VSSKKKGKKNEKKKNERKKEKAAKKAAMKRASTSTAPRVASDAAAGDVIVLDSAQVGSPPREGEVLEVIRGDLRVSYRVRWPDGHQTLISPSAGIARFVRGSRPA
jgi:sRNA-binding protein